MEHEHKHQDRMPQAWKRVSSLPILDQLNIDQFTDPLGTVPEESMSKVGVMTARVGAAMRICWDDKVKSTSTIVAIALDERGRSWVQTENSFYCITSMPGKSTEHHGQIEEHLEAVAEPRRRTLSNLWGLLRKKS